MQKKVAIVTGASSGIGLACARELSGRGYNIVLAARSVDKIGEEAEKLRSSGHDALAVSTDVSLEQDCKRLIDETAGYFGRIDVLINNAGISMRALFSQTELDVLRRLMDVNFWGTVYCTKYALPYLIEANGSVAGISSVAGIQGLPGRTGYSASKFAMHGFLEALRVENMKTGLHVLIAAPGFTSSNIRKTALAADGTQQGESPRSEDKMMPADEVARHIVRAIERRKRTLVLTSQGKSTAMLKKFFPGLLDRLVYNHLAKEPDSPFSKV